jgi:hypothetical protein
MHMTMASRLFLLQTMPPFRLIHPKFTRRRGTNYIIGLIYIVHIGRYNSSIHALISTYTSHTIIIIS